MPMTPKVQRVEVGFNAGNTMLTMAQDYKNINRVVGELIQNALDANATKVLVIINLKSMSLNVFDDGIGCSKDEFIKKVQNIGSSDKAKQDGKGGKFGTGNLAALGIMGENGSYKFISRPVDKPRSTDPYFSASIDYDTLKNAKDAFFDFVDMPVHTFRGYDAPTDVSMMTSYVKCTSIQKSALRSWLKEDANTAVNDMCESIGGGQYAPLIKARNVKVTIYLVPKDGENIIKDVEVAEFTGTKNELITIKTPSGPVIFEMFMTKTPVPDPIIKIRHKKVIDIDMRGMDEWAKYKKVLGSGYIQGYIHINFCEPNAERNNLLWTEDRISFSDAIAAFIDQYAENSVAEAKRHVELDRRKVLLGKAMKSIDEWVKEDPTLLGPEFYGAISSGHSDVKGKKVHVGKQVSPDDKDGDGEDEYRPRLKRKPQNENKNMKHNSSDAPGDRGTDRVVVKGQSGVTVMFAEDIVMWHKKLEDGILWVNMSHKDYVRVAQMGEQQEQEYFKLLIASALTESKLRRELGDDAANKFREGFENITIMGVIAH